MLTMCTKSFLLAVGTAAALIAAGCAGQVVEAPAVETMMDPDTPVTEGPGNFGIGSSWVYNHTLNGETVEMTGTLVDRMQRRGREVYVISDAVALRDPGFPCDGADGSLWDVENDAWIACTSDGKILASDSPYHGRYDWPLQVGKTWTTRYMWRDNVLHPDWSGMSSQDWAVVAWEEVTVPAGTFEAYKVVRTRGSWETAHEDVEMLWYAPEVQATVKSIWHRSPNDGYGGAEHMWELVSLDLK